jgi:hypothetical protein
MRAVILTIRKGSREGMLIPSKEAFARIGNLTFTQLVTLRHRGAFSTVSATFAACCQHAKYLHWGEGEKPLLDIWYEVS